MQHKKNTIYHLLVTIVLGVGFFACSSRSDNESLLLHLTDLAGDEGELTFSPDGRQLAFTSEINGNKDIYIKSIYGETVQQIGDPDKAEYHPAWSPDGNQLAYTVLKDTLETIYIEDLHSSAFITIAPTNVRCFRPAWSPDGNYLVFNGNDGQSVDVYLAESLSGKYEKLTDEPGSELHFGFSPNGKYIGYNKRGGPDEDLFAISLDGVEKINITQHADHEWYPHWSPKGDKVLFYSTWGTEMTEVWTVDFPNHKFTRISNHIVEDYGGIFSPDGDKVLFISKRGGHNDLYLFDFQTNKTQCLNLEKNLRGGWPQWSPDGKTLAYATNLEEAYLYHLDISSGAVQRLTNGEAMEVLADISPDAERVAFVSSGGGSESNIMVFDYASGEVAPLVSTYHYQTWPRYSHKTGKLGYIQGPGGSIRTNDIYAFSPGKKDTFRLTSSGGVRHFIWSPDDSEIFYAYDSSANYRYDIWKLDVFTGKTEPFLQSPASVIPTSIAPDGTNLLYHGDIDGFTKIYRLFLDKNKSDQMHIQLIAGWDAVYSPDGQQILFVSNENEEKYVDLYIINKAGDEVQRLTNDRYRETNPKWSRDGKSIIFSSQQGNKDIWMYNDPALKYEH